MNSESKTCTSCYEADVGVVGGDPGGVGATICAARAAADTVLIESF